VRPAVQSDSWPAVGLLVAGCGGNGAAAANSGCTTITTRVTASTVGAAGSSLTILPGSLGGVLTDLAVASSSVYVATVDPPLTYTSLSQSAPTKAAGSPTGEVEALSLATGKVEWDSKVPELPLGAVTVSNDLVFTTLYDGALIGLNRTTGAIVYRRRLPTSANSPIAIAGNIVIVPAGGPITSTGGGDPQVVAYTLP